MQVSDHHSHFVSKQRCLGLVLTCKVTWDTPQWRPAEPWWGLGHGTGDRWCGAWSQSWWPDGPYQQTRGHTWWVEAEQLNKGSDLAPRPFQWYWMPPKTRDINTQISAVDRQETYLLILQHICIYKSFSTDSVQRSWSPHVWQEADLQDMQQELLVINTVDSVKEQHHGGLVVWDKTCRHLWLNYLTICGLDRSNHNERRCQNMLKYYTFTQYIQSTLYLTFAVGRNLHWQADNSHQVLYGHQRPQDGPDSQSFTLACLDQL